MGYIKKLKNNELVGGTDKHTIYPVTSAEAVFEEVIEDGESNFKSQKFLNNNITGDRINEGTITDYNIAVGTITKGKLTSQVQTMLDEGQKKALTPKGNYDSETEYEALDLVFDPVTNSSYISLVTPNVGHPVDENAEGYEEGWWEKTLDGTAVNTAQAAINDKVDELVEQVDEAIEQARQDLQDATNAANNAAQYATQTTDDKVAWVDEQVDSLTAYEVSPSLNTTSIVPTQTKVVAGALGYFTCETLSGTALKEVVNPYGYALPTNGGAMKIKMINANTAANATLKIGTETAKPLFYNGERASATNSWDANEVISVYYDGTNYQASNSQGGSNKKIDAYLYGELRNLNAGETYTNNEAVKTTDKQLLRLIKDIQKMNLTDAIAVGDLKVYSTNTYKAQKAIAAYSNATTYSDGDYAIGRPATYLISVDISSMTVSEDTNIQVTIGEETKTITVTSLSTANSIATDIATAFETIEGWTLTNNENGTLTLRNLVAGVNTITISSEVGETGIVITPTLTAGNLVLCQYDGSTDVWNTVTLANYAADAAEINEVDVTKMWQKVDATWLGTMANGAVKQAVVPKLYEDFGYNNDGALTQKFVTDMLAYEESISFSTFTYINKYCIQNNNTKWALNNNFGFYYRRVSPGQRIVIKAKDNYATYYAWLAEQDFSKISSSKTIVYAPGYSSHIMIPKGKKVIVDVPAGTVYLYVCRYGISSSSKTDRRAEYVHSINSRINTLDYFKKAEWGKELDLSGYDAPLRWISSNTWTLNTNPSGTAQKSGTRSQLIKLTEGTYTIYADGHDCRYTVVSDNDTTAGNPVQYYEGYTGWKYLLNRMSAQIVVPKDTPCWLLVTHYYDFTNSIDWSHPRLFKRTEYKELIGDIKYSGYDIKDITSGVGNWLSNGTVKFTEENHGNVKITQTSTYSSTRIGLNLGVIPANCLLRIRFDLSKNTCHSNTAYFVLQQHIDSQDRYETKILTDINGRRHYMNGPGGHYDFVFNPENWYQIGFNSNFGSYEIVISNFKLEALIPKSLEKSDQCVSAHSIGTEWLRLLHFSDIHGNGDAAAEIRKFYDKNKSHIDNMLCTGDVMAMNIASSFDFYKLNKLTDALLTIGNHDTAVQGGNTYTTHIPYATQFNTYYKDYIDNWGVVRPENATDECYYYKDYTSKNIRLICLDVMVMNTVVDGGTRNEEQLTWFTNTLADAKENGYTVVVAAHYPPLYTAKHKLGLPIIDEKTGCCTTFSYINTGTQEMREEEGGPIINYDKINGVLAELTTPEQGSWLDERYLTAVDNFIADTGSGKGKFAVWLCGHKHADLFYYAPGHPDILVMAITTTKDYDDTDGVYEKEYPMVANLISINSGFIKVTRIGRDKDRFLRHIGTLTYAYGRRRVIYND